LLVTAIISESSTTRQKAIEQFTIALDAINLDRPPGAQEAIYLGKLVGQVLSGEKTIDDVKNLKEVLGEDWGDCLSYYAVMNLLTRYRRMLRDSENVSQASKHLRKWFDTNMTMAAVAEKHNELYAIAQNGTADDHIDTDPILDTNELFAQLDWTVLPPGEKEMIKEAEDIVAGAHGEVKIDLERLNVLKAIKDAWGADRSYYARGRLKSPRKVSVDGQEHPDEYIVLVLQQLDGSGNVVCEHAIAESPIAGPNAMYVFRGDVSPDHNWREVYSLPKKEARRLGARAVKHTTVGDKPLLETMTEKITYLITCEPDEFAAIEFNGRSMIRIKKLGEIAAPGIVGIDAAA
ncbi:MAG TPA: hypothetical protein VG964_00220, partial [Candidatus Saccharimonadales bacterium]|nr:hypothetical protein [Candidatus Saccharimonadales bacterium]